MLFAGMERTGSVAVYDAADSAAPRFGQLVRLDPHSRNDSRPEGIAVVPERDLVFVANEDDDTVSILRRTPDATEGVPRPLQGVQPVSPRTAWNAFVEFERLGDGLYLAAGEGYAGGRQPGGLWTIVFEEDTPVVVDAFAVDVPAVELEEPFAIEVDHRRDGVWIVTRTGRVYLVGDDGAVRRTVELGQIGEPSGALVDGDALWVAAGSSLVRADLDTGDVVSYDTNAPQLRSLFRLPYGGIGTTLGNGRNGLQVRRVAPEAVDPTGLMPLGLVTDLPAAELPWTDGRRFAPEAVLPDGDDATVVWPSVGDLDAPQTRFIRYPGALAPAVDRHRADVSAAMSTAPVTLPAGSGFEVELTVDRPGLAIAEVRPTGGGHRAWTVAAVPDVATIDDGVRTGTSTLRWLAPARDGSSDLRIRYVTAGGAQSWSEPIQGALNVETDPAASVSLTQPTMSNPTYVAVGGGFQARVQADRGGTVRLLARAAGTETFIPIAELDVYGNRTFTATAPELDPAATSLVAHDLRLEFRAGGDAEPVTVDAPRALIVVPNAPATVTLDAPTPGTTVAAGQRVTARITIDQPGTLTWSRVPPDGGEPVALHVNSPLTRPGSVVASWTNQGPDGAWDIAVTFTNLAGAVTERVFDDVVIVETPAAAVTLVSPTTTEPWRFPNLTSASTIRFSLSSPGRAVIEARPTGGDQWSPIADETYTVAPDTVVEHDLSWMTLPAGAYDLRVTFTNALGQTAEDLQTAALEVVDQTPTFALIEPTTANPAVVRPGEEFRLWTASDVVPVPNRDLQVLARAAGTGVPFQQLWSLGNPDSSEGLRVRVPITAGDYDLRLSYTRPDGQFFTVDEPAALTVRADAPAMVLRSPTASRPLRLAPGATTRVKLHSRRAGSYLVQVRPEGGDWADVASITVTTNPAAERSAQLRLDAAGTYDLRVTEVDGSGQEDLQLGAVTVGPTPQAPVVVDQFGGDHVTVRNLTGGPVDLGGWALVGCFDNVDVTAAAIPAGTLLGAGERLLIGNPRSVTEWDVLLATLNIPGVALLDSDGALVDSVSISGNPANRCLEQAPAPAYTTTTPVRRDTAGTDTGDNSADFILAQ